MQVCHTRLVISRRRGKIPKADLVEQAVLGKKKATCRVMKERTKATYRNAWARQEHVRLQENWAFASIFGWGLIREFQEDVEVNVLFEYYPNLLEMLGCVGFSRAQYIDEFCDGDENCKVCMVHFSYVPLTSEPAAPNR